MLESLVSKVGIFNKLLTAINNNMAVSIFGANFGEQLAILSEQTNVLYVVPNKDSAIKAFNALTMSGKNCRMVINKFEPSIEEIVNTNEMVLTMAIGDILCGEANYLIVTPEVLLNKLPSKNDFINTFLTLKVSESYNLKQLKQKLVLLGFKSVDADVEQMEFSFKGDVLTVFPQNFETPIRISFFDDEIEYIKVLSENLVETKNEINKVTILPSRLVTNNFELPNINFNSLTQEQKLNLEDKLEKLEINKASNKIDSWVHPFLNLESSIFSYFDGGYVFFDSPKLIINEIKQQLAKFKEEYLEELKCGNFLPQHKNFYFDEKNVFKFDNCALVAFQNINNANNIFKPNAVFSVVSSPLINYSFQSLTLKEDVSKFCLNGYTVILYAGSTALATELKNKLQANNQNIFIVNAISQVSKGAINIVKKDLGYSYCLPDEKLVVIGLHKKVPLNKPVKLESEDAFGFLPSVGDFVVHSTFGIGKCVALTKLTLNNITKDYVQLEYKGGDKLFLPVENIDSLSKYLGSDKAPKLNKLGTNDFIKTKQKVKAGLKQLTFNLKKVYAERSKCNGIKFADNDEIMEEFEKSFPYSLTADQEVAVNNIKQDMVTGKVMDRLVCGDVGYGKTEVAMRAAFRAILSGYQVMLLCPTTILSEQHYNTILSRMQNFGVRVEVLNRFKTKAEAKTILKKLADGEIDILCGTHRLLSSDVEFKKLGFLILDEEQRFGVEHKEKIKKLKTNIDVLTLSATPIPRTMHISLIGVKDISVIATPPFNRIPVNANVSEYDEHIIKSYIERELERAGQVLIVYNRVETIYDFAKTIKNLVGENVVIDVAHGQMSENILENSIFNLYNNKTQILISTTLIENGIDLPNANTLIVVDADNLGLSQLYQLKGRIGRSDKQAYALFTYAKGKVLTDEAYKRLSAIIEYSGLGNGFKIAMRDLEIRGAGSVFGAEQSGHIESVGYSMYLTLLNDAIKEGDGLESESFSDVKMDCYFEANLPNYYVSGTGARISAYSQISKLSSLEQMASLSEKFNESYGEVPQELLRLMYVAVIKNLTKTLGVKKVSIGMSEVKIKFVNSNEKTLKIASQICNNKILKANLNLENGVEVLLKVLQSVEKTCISIINILNNFNNN